MKEFQFNAWVVFGLVGQILFGSRFIVQWIASERRKQSYIPVVFWWLSLSGGIITAVYAIHIRDTVFTIAQCAGLLVYLRNLTLIYRRGDAQSDTQDATPSDRT